MPDEYDDDEGESQDSAVIQALRKKAKRADAAEAEMQTLRTENLILKAGLDLTPAQTKALLAAHEGELEVESILKTAADVLNKRPRASTEAEAPTGADADEQAALGAMQEATAAAEASEAHKVTVDELIANAKNETELLAVLANAGIGVNAEQ